MLLNRHLTILIGLLITLSTRAQSSSFSYSDEFGHTITFKENIELLTREFDSNLIRKYVDGEDFGLENTEVKFEIDVIKIEKKNKNNYILEVRKTPITKDIKVIIRHLGGWQYYRLKVKRKKGEIRDVKISYLYSII